MSKIFELIAVNVIATFFVLNNVKVQVKNILNSNTIKLLCNQKYLNK